MTPDELEKEAERILGIVRNPDTLSSGHIEIAVERLRAVHDAAIEKAASMEACTFRNLYDGENDLAKRIHVAVGRDIRALKMSSANASETGDEK